MSIRSLDPPLPTGLDALDSVLRGGLNRYSITEVVGKAGMGMKKDSENCKKCSAFVFFSKTILIINLIIDTR